MALTPRSPVSPEVAAELERVVERWRQLPLDHAISNAGRVRALVQSLADGVAEANGVAVSAVPDLGPATLMDQLTVLVYDASAAAAGTSTAVTSAAATSEASTSEASTSTAVTSTLAEDLASLRRELR